MEGDLHFHEELSPANSRSHAVLPAGSEHVPPGGAGRVQLEAYISLPLPDDTIIYHTKDNQARSGYLQGNETTNIARGTV